jgi:hypothetical protein
VSSIVASAPIEALASLELFATEVVPKLRTKEPARRRA